MVVRGAPAIGIAAAYGIALAAALGEDLAAAGRGAPRFAADGGEPRLGARRDAAPTRRPSTPGRFTATRSNAAAQMSAHAAALLSPGTRALTHCNAGGLATGGYGSAVGALIAAWERELLDARLGRRDPAAAPGRPADRLGARDRRHPARRDRRLGRGLADGGRRGGRRLHRRRPDRRETATPRTRSAPTASPCSPPPRDPVLHRRAELDRRPRDREAAPRSRSRSATRPR